MLSPVEELKIQAKKLLKQDPTKPELLALSKTSSPKLKHCLLFIARRYGFRDWEHARCTFSCEVDASGEGYVSGEDYGCFWYTNQCATLLNRWCRNYQDALEVQQQFGGILLPYKKQFILADRQYLNFLGLEYDDPLWEEIRHNWCQGPLGIRQALALKRLQANRYTR